MVSRHDRRRSRSRERHRSRSPGRSPQKHRHRESRSPSPRGGSRRSPQARRGHSYEARDRHRDRPAYREDRRDDSYNDRSQAHDGPRAHSERGHGQQLPGPPPGPPPRGPGAPRGSPPPRGRGGRAGSPSGHKPRWGKDDDQEGERKKEPTPPPDFGYSGKLVEETNKVNGVVCKYTEPAESRKPERRWRLYVWKNNQLLDNPLQIHRQNWFMFGRERRLVDIPTDHPSCSKQHAVLQYRLVEVPDDYGVNQQVVKPYLMDLSSVNGTFINGDRLEGNRYYELLEKDVIKFGSSSREYILLAEDTTTE